MGFSCTDGSFKIYIIEHKYLKKGEWKFSGDCGQWLAEGASRIAKNYDEKLKILDNYRKLLHPLNACGPCWQETGIQGSYDKAAVIKVAELMARLNPKHKFRVSELFIEQTTKPVVVYEYFE